MSDEPAPDPAALIARWESLDESRRSAAVARSHARALLGRLREMDDIPWAVNSAVSLLWHIEDIAAQADERFAAHDHATALALHTLARSQAGPVEVGAWTYRGTNHGRLWVVVREPIEFAAAHACTAIENETETA